MTRLARMCLDWRALLILAAIGVGIWIFAPGHVLKALPFLLLAVCPLSMFLLMGMMGKMGRRGEPGHQVSEASGGCGDPDPIARLAELEKKQADLQSEIASVRSEIERPEKVNRGSAEANEA